MGPINYLAQFPQQDFLASLQGGLQVGASIRALQERQAAQEAAAAAQAQYAADVDNARRMRTPEAFQDLILKYPQHREAFKDVLAATTTQQQENELRDMGALAAMLRQGNTDTAKARLEERIRLKRDAGQPVDQEEALLQTVIQDPQTALAATLEAISYMPKGDMVLTNLGKLGAERRAEQAQGPAMREAEAKATQAEVAAKYAESAALKDLELKGWNITAIKEDIGFKRESNRIAAMNAALARSRNDIERQRLQLELDNAVSARESKAREKVAEVESARFNVDNMLNTVERIKRNPALNDVIGGIEGRLPAVSDDSTDAIALIETLGSQAFLSQIPNVKGMGQLSNAEGEKLQAALQNLGRVQSEKQFRANLDEAARLLGKARSNIATRYGVPDTKPDTPAAPGARPPLDSFIR